MAHDVRMRGFTRRHSYDEALALVLGRVAPLEPEPLRLSQAAGRVLARRVEADVDLPAFPKSAVDGYAVKAEDTFGAGPFSPASLPLVGESLPGRPWQSSLSPLQAVRIMTGAPLPDGADAVVMAEYSEEKSDGSRRVVEVTAAVPPMRNVCPVGEDVRCGTTVLPEGRRLRAEDLGLLAALQTGSIQAYRQPRVTLFTCGAELIDPEQIDGRSPYTTVDCNTVMLEALVRAHGAIPDRRGIVPEDPAVLRALLLEAPADLLVTTGATSVGEEDLLPPLVRELGELWVHGVSIKPGSPVGMGAVAGRPVFLLPGNPVAAWVAFELFVRPVLQVLQGLPPGRLDRPVHARLARKVASSPGRVDFVRTRLEGDVAHPIGSGGAGVLTTLTRADGYFLVPAEAEGLEAGEQVEVFLL